MKIFSIIRLAEIFLHYQPTSTVEIPYWLNPLTVFPLPLLCVFGTSFFAGIYHVFDKIFQGIERKIEIYTLNMF